MASGISSTGDIIRSTIDGADLGAQGDLWAEFQAALNLLNNAQDSLRAMLTYPTVRPVEEVAQATGDEAFESASDFGVPRSLRSAPELQAFGFNFVWRDLATRFTWQFLADATADQVRAVADTAFHADSNQMFDAVFGCLMNNSAGGLRRSKEGAFCYSLWNSDGMVPPKHNGETFDGAHTHYLTTGSPTVDGVDLADLTSHVQEHGYADTPDTGQLVIFANRQETRTIRGLRVAGGSPYDYIPSEASSTYLTDQQIVGDIPPAQYGRINIIGSFGPAFISESNLVPAGYVIAVASAGPDSPRNPIGLREHANVQLRGLQQVGGLPEYPIQASHFIRGFGTGVRHRGAAAVMQVTESPTYTTPAQFVPVLA